MIKEFEKIEGHIHSNPYVDCRVNGKHFKGKIDTGADISVIPEYLILTNSPSVERITVTGHSGIPEKLWTKDVIINIDEIGIFQPRRGVLTRRGYTGLIGMDIISQCELHILGNIFILELMENVKGEVRINGNR